MACPLVSVVIPVYKGEKTVLKAVESVIRQRFRPLELIVIDDGSKDASSSIIEGFIKSKGFADFKLLRHNVNVGLSRTLNDGIKEARGDFVLILHQDCELVGDDWVEKALAFMNDERIAVITGYYGIPDVKDDSFVKRAFGVLRKQFHSRPSIAYEEVTFSEGKCDLYRKRLLLEVGGFPTNYRIAGEDLVVSYRLRKMGYKILKCYDLPVVQRFGGAAESFWGNMWKEFLFGKAMGGVFSEFKLFLFKGIKSSKYSGSRSLHRASQPAFVVALVFFALFSFLLAWWFVHFLVGLLLIRHIYYVFRSFFELKRYVNPVKHLLFESIATASIGVATDFAYSLGFGYGFVYSHLKRQL
jgi:glycosyltransferase involved in cell wall biosynthesis